MNRGEAVTLERLGDGRLLSDLFTQMYVFVYQIAYFRLARLHVAVNLRSAFSDCDITVFFVILSLQN